MKCNVHRTKQLRGFTIVEVALGMAGLVLIVVACMNGRLYVGGNLVVNGLHTHEDQPGIYLVGTDEQPIEIQGPVVIPGDVVIKGKITGQGTLYVGGNLYLAGDLTYRNGPNFSTPPATMIPRQRDEWVVNKRDRDLVAYAVRKSIFAGDVNSSNWRQYCYNASGYGLRDVGDESQLGADGIRNTGDDGIPHLDTTGDGVPDSAWYDANGNGIVDGKPGQIPHGDQRIAYLPGRGDRVQLDPPVGV